MKEIVREELVKLGLSQSLIHQGRHSNRLKSPVYLRKILRKSRNPLYIRGSIPTSGFLMVRRAFLIAKSQSLIHQGRHSNKKLHALSVKEKECRNPLYIREGSVD